MWINGDYIDFIITDDGHLMITVNDNDILIKKDFFTVSDPTINANGNRISPTKL